MSEKKPGPKILLPSSSPLVVLTKFFSSHDEGYIWMQPNRMHVTKTCVLLENVNKK
jgi:hypothetical protein